MRRRPRVFFPAVLAFFAWLPTCGGGQAHVAESTSAARAPPVRRDGLFWTISSPRATAYLLGSIHVGRPDFYPLAPRIEAAFADCSTLVLELDLSRPGQRELIFALLQEMRLAPDDTLENYVSAVTLQKLRALLARHGLSSERALRLRPWALALMIGMLEQQRVAARAPGIDMYLAERAHAKKRFVGLEQPEEQTDVFNNLSKRDQGLMLEEALTKRLEEPDLLDKLLDAWKRGDEVALNDFVVGELGAPQYRAVYEAMYVERNVNMASRIAWLLDEGGTYFIAVGAGHLVGRDNVVDQLRRHGLEVERR